MNMMDRGKYSGDNWGLVTPVDLEVEREKHGYELLEDKIIKCADCGLKLVEIIKVSDEDIKKMVKAACPCGGESFIYEVDGKTFIQPIDGLTINNMPTEIVDNIMHITVEVIKT